MRLERCMASWPPHPPGRQVTDPPRVEGGDTDFTSYKELRRKGSPSSPSSGNRCFPDPECPLGLTTPPPTARCCPKMRSGCWLCRSLGRFTLQDIKSCQITPKAKTAVSKTPQQIICLVFVSGSGFRFVLGLSMLLSTPSVTGTPDAPPPVQEPGALLVHLHWMQEGET